MLKGLRDLCVHRRGENGYVCVIGAKGINGGLRHLQSAATGTARRSWTSGILRADSSLRRLWTRPWHPAWDGFSLTSIGGKQGGGGAEDENALP